MEYVSIYSCYLVLCYLKLLQWCPTAYRNKYQYPTAWNIRPCLLDSFTSSTPPHPSRGLLSYTLVTLWTLVLSSGNFSPAPHTHTLACLQANSPYFSTKLKILPPQGIFCPFPPVLLLRPITSPHCRPLLQPIIIYLKCLCICLSLNFELAEGMDATSLIYHFF